MRVRSLAAGAVNKPLRMVGLEIKKMQPELHSKEDSIVVPTEQLPEPIQKENFDEYKWLIRIGIKSILDIGANEGQFAEMIHKIIPHAGITSFEPLPDCYERLLENGVCLGDFKAYNYALGDTDGKTKIYRSEFSPSSSLLPMGNLHKKAFPFTKNGSVEIIKVKKLDDLNLKLESPILVKIDVQGFEDKVINGGIKTISMADVIIVELSFEKLYEGQPMFDQIYNRLKELGFSYHGNWYQNNDVRDGKALQADGIFIKDKPIHRKKK